MFGILKVVLGFFSMYRLVIFGTVLAGGLVWLTTHFYLDGKRKALVEDQEQQLEVAVMVVHGLKDNIKILNIRIEEANAEKIRVMVRERILVVKAHKKAEAVSAENELIKAELEMSRFNTIEAIRDDEDFADWVDWNVPLAGWSLLRDAAEGRAGPD
jgi:hypothetical protein